MLVIVRKANRRSNERPYRENHMRNCNQRMLKMAIEEWSNYESPNMQNFLLTERNWTRLHSAPTP